MLASGTEGGDGGFLQRSLTAVDHPLPQMGKTPHSFIGLKGYVQELL
jgi:hypothetical protein